MSTADNSQPTSPAPAPSLAPVDNSQVVPAPVPASQPVVAPVAADGTQPGPSSSPTTSQPEADNGGRGEGWDMDKQRLNFSTYNKLMDGLRTLPPELLKDDNATPAGTTAPAPVVVPAPVPAAATTTLPAPAPALPTPGATDEVEDLTLGEGLPLPGQNPNPHKQIKFRPQSEVDVSALRIAKATNKEVTSLEVINSARQLHNLPPLGGTPAVAPAAAPVPGAPAATPAPAPAPDPNAPPTTVADAEARILALKSERRTAKENFDFQKEEELETQIETLQDLRQLAHARGHPRSAAAADGAANLPNRVEEEQRPCCHALPSARGRKFPVASPGHRVAGRCPTAQRPSLQRSSGGIPVCAGGRQRASDRTYLRARGPCRGTRASASLVHVSAFPGQSAAVCPDLRRGHPQWSTATQHGYHGRAVDRGNDEVA